MRWSRALRFVYAAASTVVAFACGKVESEVILERDAHERVVEITGLSGRPLTFSDHFATDQRDLSGTPLAVDLTADGSIWLIDEHRVLRANADLEIVQSVGRFGRGPGEFAYLNAICVTPIDTVVLQDGAQRFTVLAADGSFVRHFHAQSNASIGRNSCLNDGTLLGLTIVRRDSARILALSTDGLVVRPLSSFSLANELLFDFQSEVNATSTGYLYGDPVEGLINLFDMDAATLRTYRINELSQAAIELAKRPSMAAAAGSDAPSGPVENRAKHFRSVMVASDSLLWLQEVMEPGANGQAWTAYNPDTGQSRVRVLLRTPDRPETRMKLLAITPERFVFSFQDEMGNLSVRVVDR